MEPLHCPGCDLLRTQPVYLQHLLWYLRVPIKSMAQEAADQFSHACYIVTSQVEQNVEDSLASAVRQAVTQLSKCLIGDKKTEVPALFYVTLVLERNQRLELRPSVQVIRAGRYHSVCALSLSPRCRACNGICVSAFLISEIIRVGLMCCP